MTTLFQTAMDWAGSFLTTHRIDARLNATHYGDGFSVHQEMGARVTEQNGTVSIDISEYEAPIGGASPEAQREVGERAITRLAEINGLDPWDVERFAVKLLKAAVLAQAQHEAARESEPAYRPVTDYGRAKGVVS